MKLLNRLFLLCMLACAVSCCCHYEKPEKYFPRHEPLNTLCSFVYAIDTGQWESAYDCLTGRSQDAITYTKFKLFIYLFDDPVTGLSVWQAIQDTVKSAVDELPLVKQGPSAFEARMELSPMSVGPDGKTTISFDLTLYFLLEARGEDKPRWRFDLERTVREQNSGASAISGNFR